MVLVEGAVAMVKVPMKSNQDFDQVKSEFNEVTGFDFCQVKSEFHSSDIRLNNRAFSVLTVRYFSYQSGAVCK